MSNSPYFDQIEAYVNGKLHEEERIRFEEAVKEDKELEMEVQIHRDIVSTLKNQDVFAFKEKLSAFAEKRGEVDSVEEKKNTSIKWMYWGLAIAALIVSLFLLLRENPDKPERQSMPFSKEYAIDPSSNMCNGEFRSARNGDSQLNTDELCEKVEHIFKSGDYGPALIHLDELITQTGDTAYWTYFKGYCYLQLEEFDSSIQSYQYCIDPSHNLSRDKARNSHYYISFAYYLRGKTGDHQNAKNNLEQFININPNSILIDKAEKLLKEFGEANPTL